ncbi:MAG: hypothetical protein ACJ77A_13495 [Actinomycetota bacterium]
MKGVVSRGASSALAVTLLVSCTSSPSGGGGSPTAVESSPFAARSATPATAGSPAPTTTGPALVRRPLHLPARGADGRCPASSGRRYSNDLFGGTILGRGPVLPLVAPDRRGDVAAALRGVLRFRRSPEHPRWLSLKTLWFSFPRYGGPVLIRGSRLDGRRRVRLGEEPTLLAIEGAAGPTINGGHGFREWPGATWLRAPGCYSWQVDGVGFTLVIPFRAVFTRSR